MKQALFIISFFSVVIILLSINSCNSGTSSGISSLPDDSATISLGKNSFLTKCANCHNFTQNGIGPQLAGITSKYSIDWIRNFIKDPKKVIDAGDTNAVKLFKRYKTIMPSFAHLPDEEIDAIIAFTHIQKKRERKPVIIDTNDIKNPIADTIATSDLVIGVDSVTQIPPSSDQPPITRIIKLDYQPGTNELFILDLRGKLYKLQDGKPVVYMDMALLKHDFIHNPGFATGFGSFAFHPAFAKNGLLYTTHTEAPGSAKVHFNYPDSIPVVLQWVLTEWKTSPATFPFSGRGREIFRINMPTDIHGVQEIAFNRNVRPGDKDYGLLYIGIGDGGSAQIGFSLVSEKPEKVWGSIIRIDPLGNNSMNAQYGIPVDNPFNKEGPANAAREIYAYGFRNPHRFNWSRSGQLLAVNIGEHSIEALNLILPSRFYGWPIREGTFTQRFFNDLGKVYSLPPNDSTLNITYPVAQFDHDEGAAISGGFEYRGNLIPQLKGKYLFGDIISGKLFYVSMKELQPGKQAVIKRWNISMNGVPTTLAKLCKNRRVDLRFGMDSKGELYILTKQDGKVYKLVNSKT